MVTTRVVRRRVIIQVLAGKSLHVCPGQFCPGPLSEQGTKCWACSLVVMHGHWKAGPLVLLHILCEEMQPTSLLTAKSPIFAYPSHQLVLACNQFDLT